MGQDESCESCKFPGFASTLQNTQIHRKTLLLLRSQPINQKIELLLFVDFLLLPINPLVGPLGMGRMNQIDSLGSEGVFVPLGHMCQSP